MRGACFVVLFGSVFLGCDDGVTPALANFRFDGAAEDSPTVLLLSVDFHDGDGDLANGDLQTFIDLKPTSLGSLPLLPLFLESDVPLTATDGTLEFVLELSFGQSGVPDDGATFELGARVTDEGGNTSPTQTIKLRLDSAI